MQSSQPTHSFDRFVCENSNSCVAIDRDLACVTVGITRVIDESRQVTSRLSVNIQITINAEDVEVLLLVVHFDFNATCLFSSVDQLAHILNDECVLGQVVDAESAEAACVSLDDLKILN